MISDKFSDMRIATTIDIHGETYGVDVQYKMIGEMPFIRKVFALGSSKEINISLEQYTILYHECEDDFNRKHQIEN